LHNIVKKFEKFCHPAYKKAIKNKSFENLSLAFYLDKKYRRSEYDHSE